MILLKKTDEDGFLGTEEEKTGHNNLICGRNHTEGLAMSLTQLKMTERTESGDCSNQRTKPLWQPPAGVRLAVRECSLQPLMLNAYGLLELMELMELDKKNTTG